MLNLIKKTIAGIAIIVSLNSNAIADDTELDCEALFRNDINDCVRITYDWDCYSVLCTYQRDSLFYGQCVSDSRRAFKACDNVRLEIRERRQREEYQRYLESYNRENARLNAIEDAKRMAERMAQQMTPQNTNIPTPYPSSPSMYQYSNN